MGTIGAPNYNRVIAYQRFAHGALAADSKLLTTGPASFGAAPNYQAPNSDSDTNLRITNVPADLVLVPGGLMYVHGDLHQSSIDYAARRIRGGDARQAVFDCVLLGRFRGEPRHRRRRLDMTFRTSDATSDKGVVLVHLAVILTVLMLASGLAVDTGRAYVVKAQLTKAVDGAALGAARMLNSGDPEGRRGAHLRRELPAPATWALPRSRIPATDPNFFSLETIPATGVNVVTIRATATMPTTFMRVANLDEVTVSSSGEATRRMVDLSLVLDVSSSIGWRWFRGTRRGSGVHQWLRREQRSTGPGDVWQRRQGDR